MSGSGQYLFDASSIVASILSLRLTPLLGNFTLELAGYEIGNYLWKEFHLNQSIDSEELAELQEVFGRSLAGMRISAREHPRAKIVRLADDLELTYYDASYVSRAEELGVALVTEDERLKLKAEKLVSVKSTEELGP